MISRPTEVYCKKCQTTHSGSVERIGDEIFGIFSCKDQEKSIQLSKNADLYERITAKSYVDFTKSVPIKHKRPLVNLIEITNDCNFKCPICYAHCGPQKKPDFLSVDEVVRKVEQAKTLGADNVTLTGGEPTEHPHIIEIIRVASKHIANVMIATNGYRIGKELSFTKQLKKAGLKKIHVQFDSFNSKTHSLIRGQDYITEKKKAVENACHLGLRVQLIATITHLNAQEIPDIVNYGLDYAPHLNTIAFQLASRVGRHNIPDGPEVDREEAIRILVENSPVEGLNEGHFWPIPNFGPWGLSVHPDCGANLYIMTDGKNRKVLDVDMSMGRLFQRMSANQMSPSLFSKALIPLYYFLSETPTAKWKSMIKHLNGFLTGKGKQGLVVVGIGGFFRDSFLDVSRITHCPTQIATPTGYKSVCEHYR